MDDEVVRRILLNQSAILVALRSLAENDAHRIGLAVAYVETGKLLKKMEGRKS